MADQIKIRDAQGVWVVRAGGAVLGESSRALELTDGESAPVIYFPREDIAMAFLEPSDSSTRCPYRGLASYFSISTLGETLPDAAWSYEAPPDDMARIAGYVAFYTDRVTVEQL